MADVAVQRRPVVSAFSNPTYSSALDLDSFGEDDNDYAKLKKLQRHLE
jgi:26S proteasome regulatory subunit T3